jgi:hypothetical protein
MNVLNYIYFYSIIYINEFCKENLNLITKKNYKKINFLIIIILIL